MASSGGGGSDVHVDHDVKPNDIDTLSLFSKASDSLFLGVEAMLMPRMPDADAFE